MSSSHRTNADAGDRADVLGAVLAFVQSIMTDQFASLITSSGGTAAAAWADEYPPGSNPPLPYCLVLDGPESYQFFSNDPATGFFNHVITDGQVNVVFFAQTKAAARQLGLTFRDRVCKFPLPLPVGDGTIVDIIPATAVSAAPREPFAGPPVGFCAHRDSAFQARKR